MLENILKKFPIIPIVDFNNKTENGKYEGFFLVLSTDYFPIVLMSETLDIKEYRKFWRLMGYQVTEIEERSIEEWEKETFDNSFLLEKSSIYNEEFSKFSKDTLKLINTPENIDLFDNIKELEDEINQSFKKFIIPYKMFSNIMFYRPKSINVIKKGKIEFIVKKEEEDKVREFYEENRINYSTSNVTFLDLNLYNI